MGGPAGMNAGCFTTGNRKRGPRSAVRRGVHDVALALASFRAWPRAAAAYPVSKLLMLWKSAIRPGILSAPGEPVVRCNPRLPYSVEQAQLVDPGAGPAGWVSWVGHPGGVGIVTEQSVPVVACSSGRDGPTWPGGVSRWRELSPCQVS